MKAFKEELANLEKKVRDSKLWKLECDTKTIRIPKFIGSVLWIDKKTKRVRWAD